jgi:hypothetical protein
MYGRDDDYALRAAINDREAASVAGLELTIDALKRVEEGLAKSSLAIQKLADEVDKRGKVFFLKPGDTIRIEARDPLVDNYVLDVISVDEDGVNLVDIEQGIEFKISVIEPDKE